MEDRNIYKDIFEDFINNICSNCSNKESCNEELRIKIDRSIKCEKYKKQKEGV